ncbi:MAG: hypothetical protein RLP44_05345 [Aggregatilineales bacterium]
MTWASDGNLYTSMNDGFGWKDMPEFDGRFYNSRVYVIKGDAPNHSFHHLAEYPNLENDFTGQNTITRYYGFGILAVEDRIYNFMGTLKDPVGALENAFIGVKLIYSEDNGKTWKNQDGSSPVIWEKWEDRNKDNMLFFHEPDSVSGQPKSEY